MKFKVYRVATDGSGSILLIIFDLIKISFHYCFLETRISIIIVLGHDYWEGSFMEKLQQREK